MPERFHGEMSDLGFQSRLDLDRPIQELESLPYRPFLACEQDRADVRDHRGRRQLSGLREVAGRGRECIP